MGWEEEIVPTGRRERKYEEEFDYFIIVYGTQLPTI